MKELTRKIEWLQKENNNLEELKAD